MITVSPFSGGCDICPQGESPVVLVVHPVDQPLQLSTENLMRLLNSLNPSSWDYLEKLFHRGYEDSLRFLHGEGACLGVFGRVCNEMMHMIPCMTIHGITL